MTVGELGNVIGGSTPSRAVARYWKGHIPWVTPGELTALTTKYLEDTREHITQAGLDSCGACLLPEGTLLVTSRATIGSVALVRQPTATNQGFKSIVFARSAEPSFFYHLFQRIVSELERRASGTTFLEISGREFGAVRLPVPPLPEQRRIAEILDTLDGAIRKTEQLIAKLKLVKQGLLHDVLTRGIDDNGELRDPARHPEQFKDSPLGRIPLAWDVSSIASLCEAVIDCPHSTPIFTTDGPLVARTSHIKDGRFDVRAASRVSEREYASRIARLEPGAGDVVFTREAPVGEAFVVPEGMRICLGQRVMLLRPTPRLDPHYLVAQVYSGAVARRIELLTGGTTNPHLNVAEVRGFSIPVPPLYEQQRIAAALCDFDRWLDDEAVVAAKLRLLKAGLMEDLLTGRVRVPVEGTAA